MNEVEVVKVLMAFGIVACIAGIIWLVRDIGRSLKQTTEIKEATKRGYNDNLVRRPHQPAE